ncbi:sn-1-specific diacylglycerol lipase ABHD11-like [Ornithodoros turicata]|uniref:sn-1-specific diacylglycerol lipase ABHD11-like n=1 Tax=Ornithodoros turicata TaxID=34597 RepID=UPI003139FC55
MHINMFRNGTSLKIHIQQHCHFKVKSVKSNAFKRNVGNAYYSSRVGPQSVPLAFAEVSPTNADPSKPPIIILHGLLGSKTNWRSLSKSLTNAVRCNAFALDARNHGESPHTEDMDYMLMASDLELFMKERNIRNTILLGHSMGGRTAMTFAMTRPSLVDRLIIVDVAPTYMPHTVNEEASSYLRSMQAALPHLRPDMDVNDARREADKQLSTVVLDKGVRQFLLMNLYKGKNGYEWLANTTSLLHNLHHISKMAPLKGLTYQGETLFVCGGNSRYVRKEHHPAIKDCFPNSEIVYISGAGHWVHADKPAEFLSVVTEFLNRPR